MATTHASMNYPPFGGNQVVDSSDMMDSWVDFNAIPSPGPSRAASRVPVSQSDYSITSPASTIVPLIEEDFHSAKPSHDYSQFKQQTGLPHGTLGLSGVPSQSFSFDGFSNSGLNMDFIESSDGMNSGLGMDVDLSAPAFFFPGDAGSQQDDFVDPSSIQEESHANVRFFPGMHKQKAQQAALAKQQEQARQMHRHQNMQGHQQQESHKQQHNRSQSFAKRGSPGHSDARVEEIIGRVVNQIRQNGNMVDGMGGSSLPQVGRMRKDEDDMDEDERLLASEEGKKLSSKERRQLRNKVSARAFRSRRKEYITQLEAEVAGKVSENQELRIQNHALLEENARSRAFIEKLLRHPAFTPFLDDLSRDPSITESLPKLAPPAPVPSQTLPSSSAQDFNDYKTPISESPSQNLHVGMTMIPETPMDISMLSLGGNSWNNISIPGFNGFQHNPQIFALTELPQAPPMPDFGALSGKGGDSFVSKFMEEDAKRDYPVIERPEQEKETEVEVVSFENAEDFELYANTPATISTSAPLFSNIILPSKNSINHFELVTKPAANEEELMSMLESRCERLDSAIERMMTLGGL